MKKSLLFSTNLYLSTITLFSNQISNININSSEKNQNYNFKQWSSNPKNAIESWARPFRSDKWKVFINRDTWTNKILAWFGDGLIGKLNKNKLHDKIFNEYKSWPFYGNAIFKDWSYRKLVDYTISYTYDISTLFFSNDAINRIAFETKADFEWDTLYDASV